MGAPQATENTQQNGVEALRSLPGEIQIPAREPFHDYKSENRDLPTIFDTLRFTFRPRAHRERWHLASLYATRVAKIFRNSREIPVLAKTRRLALHSSIFADIFWGLPRYRDGPPTKCACGATNAQIAVKNLWHRCTIVS